MRHACTVLTCFNCHPHTHTHTHTRTHTRPNGQQSPRDEAVCHGPSIPVGNLWAASYLRMRYEGGSITGMIRDSFTLHLVRPIRPICSKCALKHGKYGSSAEGIQREENGSKNTQKEKCRMKRGKINWRRFKSKGMWSRRAVEVTPRTLGIFHRLVFGKKTPTFRQLVLFHLQVKSLKRNLMAPSEGVNTRMYTISKILLN